MSYNVSHNWHLTYASQNLRIHLIVLHKYFLFQDQPPCISWSLSSLNPPFCLNLGLSPSRFLHTPSGASALSFCKSSPPPTPISVYSPQPLTAEPPWPPGVPVTSHLHPLPGWHTLLSPVLLDTRVLLPSHLVGPSSCCLHLLGTCQSSSRPTYLCLDLILIESIPALPHPYLFSLEWVMKLSTFGTLKNVFWFFLMNTFKFFKVGDY